MAPLAPPPIFRSPTRPSSTLISRVRGAAVHHAPRKADVDAEEADAARRAIEECDDFFDDSFGLFDPPTPAPVRMTTVRPVPATSARISTMATVQRSRQLERTPSYDAPSVQLVSPANSFRAIPGVPSSPDRRDATVVDQRLSTSKRQGLGRVFARMGSGACEPYGGLAVSDDSRLVNQTSCNSNMMLPTPNTSFTSNATSPRHNNVPTPYYAAVLPAKRHDSFPLPPLRQTLGTGQQRSRPLLAGRTSRRNYDHNLYSDPDIPWAEGHPKRPSIPRWHDLESLSIEQMDAFAHNDPWEGIDPDGVDLDGHNCEGDIDNPSCIASDIEGSVLVGNDPSADVVGADGERVSSAQDGPALCPEQQGLVDLILSGKNVFYTGSAGCGKSTVLRAFVKELRERGQTVNIVAPTGRAALDIGGQTTWTYAGLTPNLLQRDLSVLLRRAVEQKSIRERLWDTDVLVIDEISMVENHQLERLDLLLRKARSYYLPSLRKEPFGGVQVIITGDFCQLPPAKPFANCITCGEETEEDVSINTYRCPEHGVWADDDKWAFQSQAWRRAHLRHVYLSTIHRQSDPTFINILQRIRMGSAPTAEETRMLMRANQFNSDGQGRPVPLTNAVNLYPTRKEVEKHNRSEFVKLKSEPYQYRCLDTFEYCGVSEDRMPPDDELPPELVTKKKRNRDDTLKVFDDHKFESTHELKQGTLVVLLHNLDLSLGLCNGSQGIVCGFEECDLSSLSKNANIPHGDYKHHEVVKYAKHQAQSKVSCPVVKFLANSRRSEITRTIYPECLVNEIKCNDQTALVSRTQVPLAQAWAMTIHRSQGMTLDRVIVDVTKAWEKGQVYVALSRATSLEGLMVKGSPNGLRAGVGGDPTVQSFLKKNFPFLRAPDEQCGSDEDEYWASLGSGFGRSSPMG